MYRQVLDEKNVDAMKKLFTAFASEYWDTHFRFHSPSRKYRKEFGDKLLNSLLINVIAPLRYFEKRNTNSAKALDETVDFLAQLPPEENVVVKKFVNRRGVIRSAADSQALLELQPASQPLQSSSKDASQ